MPRHSRITKKGRRRTQSSIKKRRTGKNKNRRMRGGGMFDFFTNIFGNSSYTNVNECITAEKEKAEKKCKEKFKNPEEKPVENPPAPPAN